MKQMTDVGLDLGKWLGGAAAGALLMYMLDPDRGDARRSQATDAVRGMGRQGGQMLGNAWDKVSHLARPDGAGSLGESAQRLGRQASSALSDTMARATHSASDMASRVQQSMQGSRGDWTPALRNSAMVGGGLLGLYGLMRRSPVGIAIGLAGIAMLARGMGGQPLRSLVGGRALSRTVDLEKTLHIDASPEEVYDLWADYENFPRFMSHVVDVRDLGRGRSHWVVRGPAGSEFEWDAKLTEHSRPHRLAWRTERGAEIPQSGSVQFEPSRGGTRVTVRMSYTPPAGEIGHRIASLIGSDPKRQMDDDLARMKALIERGGAMQRETARSGGFMSRFLH
ncbi:SRPBCC family protein [Massilia solisilvae]|uniref:SRPBCC family protein n=1 Tax=Massilia solisilvae TaxID=1811225 RepID=A0ABT2BH32_9BURK|nr:SRPBCC family protein [Massilia solisilvae]MCS0607747.1 SRPBCC family protein [Massilia solisilvae]